MRSVFSMKIVQHSCLARVHMCGVVFIFLVSCVRINGVSGCWGVFLMALYCGLVCLLIL